MSHKILLDLFDKMIVSIVTYDCEIWGAYAFKTMKQLSFETKVLDFSKVYNQVSFYLCFDFIIEN